MTLPRGGPSSAGTANEVSKLGFFRLVCLMKDVIHPVQWCERVFNVVKCT